MGESAVALDRPQSRRSAKTRFFAYTATAMPGIVLVAFSRTFYLTASFDPADLTAMLGRESLPPHVAMPGAVLALWFVLACVRSWQEPAVDGVFIRKGLRLSLGDCHGESVVACGLPGPRGSCGVLATSAWHGDDRGQRRAWRCRDCRGGRLGLGYGVPKQ